MEWWTTLRLRWRSLLRRRELDRDLDEELRFHLAMKQAETGSDDAAAQRSFGSLVQYREACRELWTFAWLEVLWQDVRYALRGLRKNPGVTAIAVLSLALAIASNTAVFSIVNAVLLRALPYRDSGRIAMLWTTNALNGSLEQNTSVPNMEDWRARSHAFEEMAGYRINDAPLVEAGNPSAETEWTTYAFVSGNFFSLLGRGPLLGRLFGEPEFRSRTAVAVLSYRLWQQRFGGSASAIGKVLNVGGQEYEVIGVMPDGFRFPINETYLWVPGSLHPAWLPNHAKRDRRFWAVFGRLKHGASAAPAQSEMRFIAASLEKEYPAANEGLGVNVVPLQVQVNGKSVPFMLAILFAAVIFVLLIACANVANLLLARGLARGREIAVRTALGAGRSRIVRQLLTESLVLACAAGCLGLPLVAWSIRALTALAPANVARLDEVHIDGPVLLFTLAVSLVSGLLFGLAPGIRISSGDPNQSLHATSRNNAGAHSTRRMRSAFVVCQFALAVVLLSAAGLLIRSLIAVQSVDSGFGDRKVLTAHLRFSNTLRREQRAGLYKQAMTRLEQLPGVRAAGGVGSMFWQSAGKFGLRSVEGQTQQARADWTAMTWTTLSGEYFQALGVPLVRGRFFLESDRKDAPPVVIVNETMARRYWPGQDAVGKRIKGFDPRGQNDEWVIVAGVVKDVRSQGLERAPMAQIFEAQAQSLDETENLVVAGGRAEAVRAAIHALDRTAVIADFATLDERLRDQTAQRRFQTYLLAVFAAIALALAGAGIFGMMHYAVIQRTQEIGIRMALGAARGSVLQMVLKEGLTLAVIGAGLGIAGSLGLMRMISSLLFGVTAEDPLTFATVSVVLTAIALAGCYVPARRATKVDPLIALRHE